MTRAQDHVPKKIGPKMFVSCISETLKKLNPFEYQTELRPASKRGESVTMMRHPREKGIDYQWEVWSETGSSSIQDIFYNNNSMRLSLRKRDSGRQNRALQYRSLLGADY